MSEDERAIRQWVETWMTATKAGDAATVLNLMAEDVVFLVPGQEPFGKDVFQAASQGMKDVAIDGQSEVLEIKVLGDWAFIRSRLAITMTVPGAAPVRRAGHTLSILHKQPDGRWLLARDANLLTTRS